MRSCRRFLAGIPHFGVRSPMCYSPVRHSLPPKREGVRLACVRHAASVYPEPGSNSPSVRFICCLLAAHGVRGLSIRSVFKSRSRPSSAVVLLLVLLLALGCSQIHSRLCSPSPTLCGQADHKPSYLTGTVVDAFASLPVAVLLSTLQLSRYN